MTRTPEFFVNGKSMPSFGYEQLKQLVDEALAQAGSVVLRDLPDKS